MLRHLRSTAASTSSHSPPPPPSPAPTEDDNEENARAIAVSDQRTIYLVNMFIANTVEFLNSFAALCNDKLALLHRKIVKLDSSLTLLETKLHSIDDTNALGHSTSQKAQQCFTHEERFDPANLFGESSRKMEASNSNVREEENTSNNRSKLPLWNHVDVLDKGGQGGGNVKWRCKYCKYVGTSSYSRVKAHLLKISNGGCKICPKVTIPILAQLKSEVAKAEDEHAKTRPRNVPLPPSTVGSVASASVSSSSMDSTMLGNKKRRGPPSALEKAWAKDLRNQLDAQIARMFYSGGLSFNLARNPHFQQSYNFAANNNLSGYVPPGYNKLRTTLLQQERTHIETLLEHTRSTWPEKGVTICSDGWSVAQRRPLINFLAISEGAPMFLRAINAEGEAKTKEYIAEKLIAVIEEVGARSVVQVITDNASNCKGAGLIVEQKYNHIFWTPCVVHTLNLALKSICAAKMPRTDEEEVVFDECYWITEIAADANMIKNFIMNHGMRLSMFNEFSKLKLLAIAETRFASVVVMLKRFCMIKKALQNMVISDKWETYRDDNRGMTQTIRDLVLNEVWWDKVNYIVEFTEPIYEMIRVADTDTPCLHLIYEMWDTMIENVKKVIYRHEGKEENEESTFYLVVQNILIDRWAKGNTPLHCLAHSLNPSLQITLACICLCQSRMGGRWLL